MNDSDGINGNIMGINGADSGASGQPRKYRTILADPPWDIQQKGGRGAIQHYPLMSIKQIKALPMSELVENDAHLWLWTTNASLEQAYQVVRAWGFTPKSLMTWVKPHYTLGNYLRNATEQVIFATKGKAPIRFHGQATWLFAPLQDHSHKPEELYDIIERCSPGPYLELFARRPRHGWDKWGNEVSSDISLAHWGYPVPSDDGARFSPDGRA